MNMKNYSERIRESAEFLRGHFGPAPETALIFGSGLGVAGSRCPAKREIRFSHIPHFPDLDLAGHRRIIRLLESPSRLCLVLGRFHLYEGLSAHEVVFPVRALSEWGVGTFFLTNSAAALNRNFSKGELMLIRDHIGFFMESPLPWPGEREHDPGFTDMSAAYDRELMDLAREQAGIQGVELREGLYLGLPGPSFETPEEIRILQQMNIDAVGMSTVPEVIALRNQGKRVLGISCLTNFGTGMKPEAVTHAGVIETAESSSPALLNLLLAVAAKVRPSNGQ
jgi:purine-nucleoside phosphorylase